MADVDILFSVIFAEFYHDNTHHNKQYFIPTLKCIQFLSKGLFQIIGPHWNDLILLCSWMLNLQWSGTGFNSTP